MLLDYSEISWFSAVFASFIFIGRRPAVMPAYRQHNGFNIWSVRVLLFHKRLCMQKTKLISWFMVSVYLYEICCRHDEVWRIFELRLSMVLLAVFFLAQIRVFSLILCCVRCFVLIRCQSFVLRPGHSYPFLPEIRRGACSHASAVCAISQNSTAWFIFSYAC